MKLDQKPGAAGPSRRSLLVGGGLSLLPTARWAPA
jgi:hypothetical protein